MLNIKKKIIKNKKTNKNYKLIINEKNKQINIQEK